MMFLIMPCLPQHRPREFREQSEGICPVSGSDATRQRGGITAARCGGSLGELLLKAKRGYVVKSARICGVSERIAAMIHALVGMPVSEVTVLVSVALFIAWAYQRDWLD